MIKRYRAQSAVLSIASLSGTTASAQEVAKPALQDTPSTIPSLILLIITFAFLGLLFNLMRRSKGLQPKMDRSLQLAEEAVQLTREQIELQRETNRLLGLLITARRREE